jgi:tetratricopeptide (TPR) repeat protein
MGGDARLVTSHRLLVLLTLFLTALLAFWTSLQNGFAFDDHLAIVENKDTLPSSPFSQIWSNDIWGKDLRAIDSHRSYRPLLITLFKCIRMVSDSATSFRLVSIALHVAASFLVYVVGLDTLLLPIPVAWGAAVMFAAHPVHVEAVAAVVNMAESLHSIFYMLMFLIYQSSVNRAPERRTALSLVAESLCWLTCLAVSVLFKETGLTVVGIMLANTFVSLLHCAIYKRQELSRELLVVHGPWIALCGVAVALYILLRMMTQGHSPLNVLSVLTSIVSELGMGRFPHASIKTIKSSFYLEESQLIRKAENPFTFLPPNSQEKVLSFMYLHFRYFWVLLYPIELCAEYAFNCIPSVKALEDPRAWYSFCLYLALIVSSLLCLHRSVREKRDQAPLLALFWLVIPFIPASGLLLRLGTLLAERLLYVPSIGFCLLLSMALYSVLSRLSPRLYATAVVLVSALYCTKASQQNAVWKDDATLFKSSLKVCSNSAKLQLQVAKLHMNDGEHVQARERVDRALEIDPDFCDIGYQEALLKLFHERDIHGAMEAAADNLECVFTNTKSWELLNKVWEMQLQEVPAGHANHAQLLGLQASVAARGNMHAFACKRYNAATSAAFDGKRFAEALEMSVKAEALVPTFMRDLVPDDFSENALALRDLACFVDTLGGVVRTHISSASSPSAGLSKKLEAEARRGKAMLLSAMRTSCIVLDGPAAAESSSVVSANALSAAASLRSLVEPPATLKIAYGDEDGLLASPRFDEEQLEGYAEYLTKLADLQLFVANHGGMADRPSASSSSSSLAAGKSRQFSPGQTAQDFASRSTEARLLGIFLWSVLGKSAFGRSSFSLAASRFRQAVRWGVGESSVPSWGNTSTVEVPTATTAQMLGVGSSALPLTSPCASLYWLAHSLAAEEGEDGSPCDITALLDEFLSCREAPGATYKSANLEALKTKAKRQLKALLELDSYYKECKF